MAFINQFPYSDFHELNLDWLIKQTKESAAAITALQEEFAKITVLTEEQIQGMINVSIANNNVELYNYIAQQKSELDQILRAYTDQQIALLKVYVDAQDISVETIAKNYSDSNLDAAKAYTDAQVLTYTMMINPITGEYEDVRDVVDDIVNYFHSDDSLTAAEYDALDLTASAYDAYDLTAFQYDFEGKIHL